MEAGSSETSWISEDLHSWSLDGKPQKLASKGRIDTVREKDERVRHSG